MQIKRSSGMWIHGLDWGFVEEVEGRLEGAVGGLAGICGIAVAVSRGSMFGSSAMVRRWCWENGGAE